MSVVLVVSEMYLTCVCVSCDLNVSVLAHYNHVSPCSLT